jgi:hypothetical protein
MCEVAQCAATVALNHQIRGKPLHTLHHQLTGPISSLVVSQVELVSVLNTQAEDNASRCRTSTTAFPSGSSADVLTSQWILANPCCTILSSSHRRLMISTALLAVAICASVSSLFFSAAWRDELMHQHGTCVTMQTTKQKQAYLCPLLL